MQTLRMKARSSIAENRINLTNSKVFVLPSASTVLCALPFALPTVFDALAVLCAARVVYSVASTPSPSPTDKFR